MHDGTGKDDSKSKKDDNDRNETPDAPLPVRRRDVDESDFLLVRDDH